MKRAVLGVLGMLTALAVGLVFTYCGSSDDNKCAGGKQCCTASPCLDANQECNASGKCADKPLVCSDDNCCTEKTCMKVASTVYVFPSKTVAAATVVLEPLGAFEALQGGAAALTTVTTGTDGKFTTPCFDGAGATIALVAKIDDAPGGADNYYTTLCGVASFVGATRTCIPDPTDATSKALPQFVIPQSLVTDLQTVAAASTTLTAAEKTAVAAMHTTGFMVLIVMNKAMTVNIGGATIVDNVGAAVPNAVYPIFSPTTGRPVAYGPSTLQTVGIAIIPGPITGMPLMKAANVTYTSPIPPTGTVDYTFTAGNVGLPPGGVAFIKPVTADQ